MDATIAADSRGAFLYTRPASPEAGYPLSRPGIRRWRGHPTGVSALGRNLSLGLRCIARLDGRRWTSGSSGMCAVALSERRLNSFMRSRRARTGRSRERRDRRLSRVLYLRTPFAGHPRRPGIRIGAIAVGGCRFSVGARCCLCVDCSSHEPSGSTRGWFYCVLSITYRP